MVTNSVGSKSKSLEKSAVRFVRNEKRTDTQERHCVDRNRSDTITARRTSNYLYYTEDQQLSLKSRTKGKSCTF